MFHIKKSNKVIEDKAWAQMRVMLDRDMPEKRKKRRALFFWLFSAAAVTTLCWYAYTAQTGEKASQSFTLEQPLVASSDDLNKSGSTDPKPVGSITNTPVISKKINQITDAPGQGMRSDVEVDLNEYKISSNVMASNLAPENDQSGKEDNMINPAPGATDNAERTPKEADALLSVAEKENSTFSREKIISLSSLAVISPLLNFQQEFIHCPLPLTKVAAPLKTNTVNVYGGLGISMETNPSNRGWMVGSDVTLPLTGKLDLAMGLWHQRITTTTANQAFLGAVNAVLPAGSESVVNAGQWTFPLSLRFNPGFGILPYAGFSYHRLSQINWHEFSAASNDVEQTTTTNQNKDYFTSLVRQNVNKNQFTWDAGFWWKVSGRLHLKLNYSHRLNNGEAGLPSEKNAFALVGLYALK